jgi:hypothetical protein
MKEYDAVRLIIENNEYTFLRRNELDIRYFQFLILLHHTLS